MCNTYLTTFLSVSLSRKYATLKAEFNNDAKKTIVSLIKQGSWFFQGVIDSMYDSCLFYWFSKLLSCDLR